MKKLCSAGVPLQGLDPLSKLVVLLCVAALSMHWDKAAPLSVMLLFWQGPPGSGPGCLGASWEGEWGISPAWRAVVCRHRLGRTFLRGADFRRVPVNPVNSVSAAAAVCLRMFCLFMSSLIYIETTDPKQFVVMMTTRLKLPYRFVFGVSMALTFLPLLAEEGRVAADARKIRSARAPRGLTERLAQLRGRLLAVFAGAIRRIEQTAGAMDAKGFGAYPERTFFAGGGVVPGRGVADGGQRDLGAGLWFI
ncbi:hypothetical protein HMSSN036_48430 [Paenibacillus macerans]|nr:hypothetical protein HMSSN036_48430 [Paenibacillus macerans]